MDSPVRSQYKKLDSCGPGGRKCGCCGPNPSFRKKHDRIAKRSEKNEAKKAIEEELKPE